MLILFHVNFTNVTPKPFSNPHATLVSGSRGGVTFEPLPRAAEIWAGTLD